MRLLFAGLALPFPPINGHRLRTWSLLRALTGVGYQVTLVSFAEPHELGGYTPELTAVCAGVDLVPAPEIGSQVRGRLRALASPLPYGAWRFRSSAFRAALERRLVRERFDAIICDGIYNLQNLPTLSSVPVLLNKDDVAHVILERYLHHEHSLLHRLYGAFETRKVREWERAACTRVQASLVCSETDRKVLERLAPTARLFVVPNVVDTDHYLPGGDGEPHRVVFQGGMDWYPNLDAVRFFVAHILPELRRHVPAVSFRIAGRSPVEPLRRSLATIPSVEFSGSVPDMRVEIARAGVSVVPLRIGSGTRLKILEAGAMGKAVVSTRIGAEGLKFLDREEIVLADDPFEFAAATAALLGDAAWRRKLGNAARARVERDYSLLALRQALRAVLPDLVSA